MAGETTPPTGATRYLETTRGLLTHTQLAPLVAERVLELERQIVEASFDARALDSDLIREFHFAIVGDLCPDWAGRWRTIEVRVGEHQPPVPHRVPIFMQDYCEDLRVRLENVTDHVDELLLETLAFAEGRLLSIHPFTDFNGRVTRVFLRLLLRRLNLPPVDLVPTSAKEHDEFRTALRAGDSLNWQPLSQVWQRRLETFM